MVLRIQNKIKSSQHNLPFIFIYLTLDLIFFSNLGGRKLSFIYIWYPMNNKIFIRIIFLKYIENRKRERELKIPFNFIFLILIQSLNNKSQLI